ncbi:hypothetical protein HYR69_10110 [Candidatus Sumerlaeota bacterium]|nr:hypothetical protein [Candidatus Sumerlaeota bacterium]
MTAKPLGNAKFAEKVRRVLLDGLRGAAIPAKIETENIPTTKLCRVRVLTPKFKKLRHFERQNLVWRIIDHGLDKDEQLRISMILTLTPDEMNGKE